MSHQIVLYKPVTIDQFRVLNGHLRYEMEKYEELTRRNCGIKNGGLRLINQSTDQFIAYVLELAWTFLDELKKSNPARYQRILSGEEGDAIPIGICLSYFVKTRMFSEPKRLQFDIGEDIPRRANGMPVELDNAFRTIRDIRNKITANKATRHANGVLSKGFDFFTDWTGINAQGQPDRKGRRGHIGFVNLKYVLGPDWKMENESSVENQHISAFKNNYTEESSAVLILNNLKNKKKKGECGKIEDEAAKPQPTETKMTDDQQDADSHPDGMSTNIKKPEDQQDAEGIHVPVPTNAEKKDDQPPGCAAPPGSRYNTAKQLWLLLMARIYLPMLKDGRVRYNAEKTCMKHDFSQEIQQKAMVSIEEILRQYSAATLKEAIEKQAAWLENDGKRWIYTPGTFLDTTMKNGTLVSAVRELVRPGMPEQRTEMPGESLELDQRIDVLYQKILDLGCKNTRKYTFLAWSRKYGMDYMCRIYKMFRDEIYRRRLNGAPVGQEFVQGSSRKFAHMVYYGNERLSEFMRKEVSSIQKQLILDCNTPRWAKSIAKVRALSNDDIAALNRLSNQFLGVRLSKFGDLETNRNAVFLAWTYEVFWFHKAQYSTINNI